MLTVFISVLLVTGEIVFFAWNVHHGSHEHDDRLALLPLEHDLGPEVDKTHERRA
jgi:hypothetical protein